MKLAWLHKHRTVPLSRGIMKNTEKMGNLQKLQYLDDSERREFNCTALRSAPPEPTVRKTITSGILSGKRYGHFFEGTRYRVSFLAFAISVH